MFVSLLIFNVYFQVIKVDTVLKTVKFQDGGTENFDQLLIATGGWYVNK